MTEKNQRLNILANIRKARQDAGIPLTPVHWLFETILEKGQMDIDLLQSALEKERDYLMAYEMFLNAQKTQPEKTNKHNLN